MRFAWKYVAELAIHENFFTRTRPLAGFFIALVPKPAMFFL